MSRNLDEYKKKLSNLQKSEGELKNKVLVLEEEKGKLLSMLNEEVDGKTQETQKIKVIDFNKRPKYY